MDRDTKFTEAFRDVLEREGIHPQQPGLPGTLWQASSLKVPTQGSHESQQQPDNGGGCTVSLAQFQDLGLEPDEDRVEGVSGHARLVGPAQPAKRRQARSNVFRR